MRVFAESEWSWTGGIDTLCLDLIFVRDTSAERVVAAFGLDAAAGTIGEQPAYGPWIRAGQAGDWAFVLSPMLADFAGDWPIGADLEVVRGLSAGGAAVFFEFNVKIDSVRYFEDGVEVTGFEPLRSYDRWGSDPDRFAPQMRRAGLVVDPDADYRYDDVDLDQRICALEMLTLALGIRVPESVACGPLLTIRRG